MMKKLVLVVGMTAMMLACTGCGKETTVETVHITESVVEDKNEETIIEETIIEETIIEETIITEEIIRNDKAFVMSIELGKVLNEDIDETDITVIENYEGKSGYNVVIYNSEVYDVEEILNQSFNNNDSVVLTGESLSSTVSYE